MRLVKLIITKEMKMRYLVVWILMMGCTEYEGMYIDDGCTEEQIAAAYEGARRLNAYLGSDEIQIKGVYDFEGDMWYYLFDDDEYDIIACLDSESTRFKRSGAIGAERYGDIAIRDGVTGERLINLFAHEMGHILGAQDLYDDKCKKDIMYWSITDRSTFGACDAEEFGLELAE